MTVNLSLGFSPCPNDTFMFDAMVNRRVLTRGLSFQNIIEDVEELNRRALGHELDVTKLSFFTYLNVLDTYVLLNSGSALGENCGPLLIGKNEMSLHDIKNVKIAIPGEHTTANFLLSIANPEAKNKTAVLFSEIEDKVLHGEFDAGLIIHENRFTYEAKGLKKIVDLGEFWQDLTGSPIPLGGIAVKRTLGKETAQKINMVLNESIQYAFQNPAESTDFIKKHAQEMNDEVIGKHIALYVNEFSKELGEKGKNAVQKMADLARQKGLIPEKNINLFL
ncbi:MAG: 1,4-dihydroxy-6-naphthoate synthase [Nitrospinae bacterium]|nr:1,4-dihydroxy-6-naphthoate synthase [Nitrospinota bacterium]